MLLRLGYALLGLFGLLACVSQTSLYAPPIAAGQSNHNHYRIGEFVWHDLLSNDIAAAQQFYSGLFGWRFRHVTDSDGVLIVNRGKAIGSIMPRFQTVIAGKNSIWLSSLSIADIGRAAKMTQRLGGEVIEGPEELPGRGKLAIVADAQGARLILLHSQTGDPKLGEIQNGDWLWMELWAEDIKKAAYFYKKLAGFSLETRRPDENYYRFKQQEEVRAGVLKLPAGPIKPNWLVYVKVADIQKTLGKVSQLGGKVIIPPAPDQNRGKVAVIADPTGGVLAIQELTDNDR